MEKGVKIRHKKMYFNYTCFLKLLALNIETLLSILKSDWPFRSFIVNIQYLLDGLRFPWLHGIYIVMMQGWFFNSLPFTQHIYILSAQHQKHPALQF